MRLRSIDTFRWVTTGMLVVFCLTTVMIFLADLVYVSMNNTSLVEVFSSPHVRKALILSVSTSFISTALCLLVAIPSAYALSRYPFKGIIVLDIIVDLLMVMPVLVVGVSLLVFFYVGQQFADSGFYLVRWCGSAIAYCGNFFVYTKPGIVLAQFFCAVSYAIRSIKAAFDEIDPRTEQVAMTLGCTRAGAFRRVTLPLAKHGIMAGAVLSWVRAFGIFGAVIIVGGAVRGRTEVLPTAIYLEISIGRLEIALAISLLMIIVATLVLVCMRAVSGRALFGSNIGNRG